MKKNGFTLVETLIVVIIIGILAVILMRTYTFISQISFRIQQEKNITQEILFLSQVIQNLSDRNSIDYNRYLNNMGTGYLIGEKGITDILYLSGQDGSIELYSTGNCINPAIDINILTGGYQCYIELVKNGEKSVITNPQMIYISKMFFKIIPYDSSSNYIDGVSTCTNYISCIHKQGFYIFSKAYSNTYNAQRYNRIQIPIQQFFNLINTNEY